jgi:hypothetical protein
MHSLLDKYTPRGRKVMALNYRSKPCPYTLTNWDSLMSLRRVALVIEDVIGISNAQYKLLAEMLSFSNHHHR